MVDRFGPYPYKPFDGPIPAPPVQSQGEFCVTFDKKWIPYLIGVLYTLTADQTWSTDKERAMGEAENMIRDVGRQLQCAIEADTSGGIEIGEDCDMKLRYCGGRLQVCDCGTWVDVPSCDDQGQAGPITPGQPGTGTTTPPAGGGTRHYCGALGSGDTWILPTPVSSGDTLLFDSLLGAWHDSARLFWNCPDGWTYVFGTCGQNITFISTDPLPTLLHMSIVAFIDGNYYDVLKLDSLGIPTTFTVPGGISNATVTLQANIDDVARVQGEVTFCVEVTNNQVPEWEAVMEFDTSTNGWTVRDEGAYTPFVGFTDGTVTYSGTIFRGSDIQLNGITPFHLTRLRAFGSAVLGVAPLTFGIGHTTPGAYDVSQTPVTGDNFLDTGIISATGVTDLYCDLIPGRQAGADPGGSCIITKIIVNGDGLNPFV